MRQLVSSSQMRSAWTLGRARTSEDGYWVVEAADLVLGLVSAVRANMVVIAVAACEKESTDSTVVLPT